MYGNPVVEDASATPAPWTQKVLNITTWITEGHGINSHTL